MNTPLRLLETRRWTREEALERYSADVVDFWFNDNPNPFYDNAAAIYGQRKLSYETNIDVRGGTETTRY